MSKQKNLANGQSTIKLTCIQCNETTPVTTNYPEKYTEEVLKTYVCTHCKSVRGGKKNVFKPAVKPEIKPAIKEEKKSMPKKEVPVVKESEQIVKEEIVVKTSLSQSDQDIVNDVVVEIMEDLEKLGDYTDLRIAVSSAIKDNLTKKLPKDKIKEALRFSKTCYLIS